MLRKLEHQRVIIVGDVMIDRYLLGSVTRISPEAPVPVVLHRSTDDRLGGAANVALNVKALGGVPLLCSVVGHDKDGELLQHDVMSRFGISSEGLVNSPTRRTTVKTRILGNNQQVLRIDQEDLHELDDQEAELLIHRVIKLMDEQPVQVIILQDYNKGVMTPDVISLLIAEARKRGIFIAVDPKKNYFLNYRNVDLFKPNLKEIRDAVESSPDKFKVDVSLESLQRAADFLRHALNHRLTMITLSEHGLFMEGGELNRGKIFPTHTRNIADVSGAGDTVISIASMALAAGFPMDDVALLSNLAGGQVCESPGVVPVRRDILMREFEDLKG